MDNKNNECELNNILKKEENEIGAVLSTMFEALINDVNNKSKSFLDSNPAIKEFVNKHKCINPENFDLYFNYKLGNILNLMIQELNPNLSLKNISTLEFIYKQYRFLSHHIGKICDLREGSSCTVDKSRFIIGLYMKYVKTGEIPKFNPEEEHFYFPNFGTYKQWIDFCESLYALYYGEPQKFFQAYSTLIKAKMRLYKHTLYTWYVELIDGTNLLVDSHYDDYKNYFEEYYDKGEYYLIEKTLLKDKDYPIDDETQLKLLQRCRVPKTDVKRIYFKKEDKMI